ncbi:hypothetical protein EDB84DRAFT_1528145 [Lactarius hengduanensis]|nr:hypothetical protein EDB84DRAFT_1528145 [Lactarius hengduanensis]
MLSRFSALLVYVPADYNDEPKSHPPGAYGAQSYSPHHKYPQDKPYSKPYDHTYKAYALGEDKPDNKPHSEDKKYPDPSSDDKGKTRKSNDYKNRSQTARITSLASAQYYRQSHTNCSPYVSYLAGGKACTAQTVCCDNAEFYGAIAIGCTNINL